MIKILKKIGLKPLIWKIRSRIFPNDEIARTNCDLLGSYRYLEKYKYVLDKFDQQQFLEQSSLSCADKRFGFVGCRVLKMRRILCRNVWNQLKNIHLAIR